MQSVNCSTWGPGFGVKWRCGLQPMLWAGRVPADLSRICTWGSRKELGIISCACLASHRRDQELTDTLIPDNCVNTVPSVLSTEGRLVSCILSCSPLQWCFCFGCTPNLTVCAQVWTQPGFSVPAGYLHLFIFISRLEIVFYFFQNTQVVLSVLGVQKK